MAEAGFYVTGGTLRSDAPSYVERQADRDLWDALTRGEYCYVLNTRQMGKSSLMVRTAARLREAGIAVAVLDLTAIGQNLTPEQWYEGLLVSLGQQLHFEDALDDFWLDHPGLGPMQRFMAALEHKVLPGIQVSRYAGIQADGPSPPEYPNTRIPEYRPLVVFVDEIDAVRSLPFSADEFFAGIRECYNRRTQDPALERLTFCLLGVATPADLISETRMSPFNIGRRIVITDFTLDEARPLARGLKGGEAVLRRVLHWTAGQPYMTQRLCQAAGEAGIARPAELDRLCDRLFLSRQARETEDHLAFVRNRLLRSEADLAGLLDLYSQVRAGKRVSDDETDPLCAVLRLAGVVNARNGRLQTRNRIYDRVFDREWILQHMPGAELRRQREAFRRGMARAALVFGVVVAALGWLSVIAIRNAHLATTNASLARREMQRAELREVALREAAVRMIRNQIETDRARARAGRLAADRLKLLGRLEGALKDTRAQKEAAVRSATTARRAQAAAVSSAGRARSESYVAAMSAVQLAWDEANVDGVRDLLAATRDNPNRGFEWAYWAGRLHEDNRVLRGHEGAVSMARWSPDGRRLASVGQDRTLLIWDPATGRTVNRWPQPSLALAVAWSPNGERLAVLGGDARVRVLDGGTGQVTVTLTGVPAGEGKLAWSPDGRRLAAVGTGEAVVWDLLTQRIDRRITELSPVPGGLAWSPDGTRLALSERDGAVGIWETSQWRMARRLTGHRYQVNSIDYSPDGQRLVTAGTDSTARIWDAGTYKPLQVLQRYSEAIPSAIDFTGPLTPILGVIRHDTFGHDTVINSAEFSRDGRRVLTSGLDGYLLVWDSATGKVLRSFLGPSGLTSASLSPDGNSLAACGQEGLIRLWDVHLDHDPSMLQGKNGPVWSVAVSPNGRYVASAGFDSAVSLWDVRTGQLVQRLEAGVQVLFTVVFSADSRRLFAAGGAYGGDGKLCEWDVDTGRETAPEYRVPRVCLTSMALSPDGRRVALGAADGSVIVRERGSGRQTRLAGHAAPVLGLAFAPDGRLLLSTCFAKWHQAAIWSVASGSLVHELRGHTAQAMQCGFSPDGRRAVTASFDGSLRTWDVATGRTLHVFPGHSVPVTAVCFSPDGRRLFSGGGDTLVKVWDADSGKTLLSLTGHGGAVSCLAVSPDGSQVVSGSYDSSARLWRAPIPAQLGRWEAEETAARRQEARRAWEAQDRSRKARERAAAANAAGSGPARQRVPGGILVNGGFEQGLAQRTALPAESRTSGWRVTLGGAVLVGEMIGTSEGKRALYLDGQQLTAVQQVVPTVPGRRYRLRFDLSGSPVGAPVKRLRVAAAGQVRELAFDTGGSASGDLTWIGKAWEFVARERRTVLTFVSDNPPGTGEGPLVDNVSLVPLPTAPQREAAQRTAALRPLETVRRERLRDVPARDPAAGPELVDLSRHFNASLLHRWHLPGDSDVLHLAELPRGVQTLGGTRFDVRGIVQLAGLQLLARGGDYPVEALGIRVGRTATRLQFLHATGWFVSGGTRIATYVIHYADGQQREVPVVYGEDVLDWLAPAAGPTRAAVAFETSKNLPWNASGRARVFRTTWLNPRPEVAIDRIDYVSALTDCAPFLLAITAE